MYENTVPCNNILDESWDSMPVSMRAKDFCEVCETMCSQGKEIIEYNNLVNTVSSHTSSLIILDENLQQIIQQLNDLSEINQEIKAYRIMRKNLVQPGDFLLKQIVK